jgi:hypothetical protein
MLSALLNWGGRRADAAAGGNAPAPRDEPVVSSRAFPRFVASLSQKPAPVLLDFGPVLGPNVAFCGERLGCKLLIEDLLADVDRHLRGTTPDGLAASFDSRFKYGDGTVDGILCWDLFDYLDKRTSQALSRQIVRLLKPGGTVMGFFCTAAIERAAFTKFEIIDEQSLRHRYHPGVGGRKHTLPNRDIIRMFDGLVVSESFLLKNSTREMLLRKQAA